MTIDENAYPNEWQHFSDEDPLLEIDPEFKASVMTALGPILKQYRQQYRRKIALRVMRLALPMIVLITPAIRLLQKPAPVPDSELVKLNKIEQVGSRAQTEAPLRVNNILPTVITFRRKTTLVHEKHYASSQIIPQNNKPAAGERYLGAYANDRKSPLELSSSGDDSKIYSAMLPEPSPGEITPNADTRPR